MTKLTKKQQELLQRLKARFAAWEGHLANIDEPIRKKQRKKGTTISFMTAAPVAGYPTGETCPNCSKKLVYRQNRKTLEFFVGCKGFPKCRYSKNIP